MKSNRNGCPDSAFCGSEIEFFQKNAEGATVSGVFESLINNVAFVDKMTLGIHGKLRKRFSKKIEKTENLAIGGPGRPYARSLHGIYAPTGNPVEVKYGRNRVYRNLFDAKVTVRSERRPLSFAEVTEVLACLFCKGFRRSMSGTEFTCDVSIPFRFFENHILTKARSVRTLEDDRGRQTLYAGAPGGQWMLRVYQKTKSTTRVEFVLRNEFLLRAEINDLADLGALKDVSWNRLVQFPSVCQRALEELVTGKATGKQLKIILDWPRRWPTDILLEVLRDYGLPADQILRPSAVEQWLAEMQKAFVWAKGPN
jgi:hypothetical protein